MRDRSTPTLERYFFFLQKLLLLPELGDRNAVVNDTTSHRFYQMLPLKLANEEMFTSRGLGSPSDESPPRIAVSNLTASWAHVRMLSCCVYYWSVCRRERSWY